MGDRGLGTSGDMRGVCAFMSATLSWFFPDFSVSGEDECSALGARRFLTYWITAVRAGTGMSVRSPAGVPVSSQVHGVSGAG